MSFAFIKWLLLLVVCVMPIHCEIYQHRAKIKTSDGDLILEPSLDKNIYLRPNGDNSRAFVDSIDILKTIASRDSGQHETSRNEDLEKYLYGPNGILQRLQALENKIPTAPRSAISNVPMISREVDNINRKVVSLQKQFNKRPRDECDSHPCQRGGTCLNLIDGYHCLCPSNWEGRNCDVDVNECRNFVGTDLGCQNGATCINKPGTYECLCKPTWFGVHCTTKAKDCSAGDFEMCGYGTCVSVTSGEGIKCLCHQGWSTNATSVACLTDINECESHQVSRCSVNPKVECVNVPGSFRCAQCPAGYEGDGYICNDIDECIVSNGGCSPMVTCYNTIGSRICGSCPPGYQGDGVTCTFRGLCNINHGGCHSSAQCKDLPSSIGLTVQCLCPEGMDGDGLGFAGCYVSKSNYTVPCRNNTCGSNGRCHRVRFGYICICNKGYGGAHCDKSTNVCPCQNGGVCRQDSISGFRCECTAQYSGSLCQVRSNACGGILDAEEGSIAFPLSNTTTYNNNVQCAWVIHTDAKKVLNISFSRFHVLSTPECSGDFLQLHDGRMSSSQLIGRFCGNTLPKGGNIVSSHNNIFLWFHSNGGVAKAGFALHWKSINPICGGEVNAATHGHISSPGSPGPYPPNRDCYWHLIATPGKRISVHFFALDIKATCNFDYLAIYDGKHISDPLLGKYCNSTQPAPVHSASSDMLIHFHSDAYGSGHGFQIAYAPIEGIPGCGGYFTADKGELVTPNYNGVYLSNLVCEYKIRTKPETKIKIYFRLFKLESTFQCSYDYLKIYDGPSPDSRLVGKFCGTTHPATYTSSSNTLYLRFRTDINTADEGFRITYEAICEKTILGDSGIIKSPGYPLSYPQNQVCVYIIKAEPGKAIQLTFQDFDIERRYYNIYCVFDNVVIRDGADGNSTLLGKYCGGIEHIPPVQISTHNYMYVRFESDGYYNSTGFFANYTTVDTECGGIYRNMTGVINHPREDADTYEDGQTCQWLIIAPEGKRIKITWNRFAIEATPDCDRDYLEVLEVNDNNEDELLGKHCGTRKPPTLTTFTNRLHLKFVSNRRETRIYNSGFSLSYAVLDDSICGGNYTKSRGYIRSPGWPMSYKRNLDCTWTITVPIGQQIALNIKHFELESDPAGNCISIDYLEIRNGGSNTSPLIGRYCGEFILKRIISLANVLYVYFHTDSIAVRTGFSIEWDGTITGCGGTFISSTGLITSPNYPNSYHENAECFYRIVTSAGSRIRITFTELDLERSPKCADDYIEIYDGRDTNAPSIGKHCTMSTELGNIETTTNYAFLKFRSDLFTGGKGFVLNYITACNNNLTGRYGVIESPDYPNDYPNNIQCLWDIQVPKGNTMNITFTHFDIYKFVLPDWEPYHVRSYRHAYWYDSEDYDTSIYYNEDQEPCSQHYLQMKEYTDPTFSTKFCGSSLPSAVTTRSDSFQIKFSSGAIGHPRTGFRLEWVSYGCGGHIKLYGSTTLDKRLTVEKEIECEWIIETRPGRGINITFTDIYILQSKNCSTDAIEIYNGPDSKAPLLSKICHRQASVESDGNHMLVRFVKTSTLKDVHFISQIHSFKAKCGGSFKAMSGSFHSKNYPRNYYNNQDCIWYISVPENHRIEINFVDFDLYSNSDIEDGDDCGDSILIYDNNNFTPSSNYTYRICPSSNKRQIVTNYHHVVVQFKSDSEGTAKGFNAEFSVTCGALVSATRDGIVTNNKHINNFNKSCIWTIVTPALYQKISLTLTHMSLPKDVSVITNRNCPSTFLRILDGNDNQAPLIGEYCGRKVPPMVVSHGNAVTIELGSYSNRITGQFSLHYSPILNACGGTLTAEDGAIASPLFPRSYPVDIDCEWILSTSAGNTAYITFEQFDLEYSEGCNEDYLELRENDGGGKLLGVYCGSDVPTNTTNAAKIYIKFHSSSRENGQGFLLHYGYLHTNDIQGEYGKITSPLYPIVYEGAGEYNWRISSSGSNNIVLTIDNLEISSHGDINNNKLTIFDGYDDTSPILDQLSGVISQKKNIQTSSSVVYILLTLDKSNTGSIFHITWTQSSRNMESSDFKERFNCGSNKTELLLPGEISTLISPNYPRSYKNDLNCEWKYRTQMGRQVSVAFIDFQVEERPGCFADSITIYSASATEDWKLIKEACTFKSVSEEIRSSIYMKIKFTTDSFVTRKGFFALVHSKCGGLITDLSGEFGPTWFDAHTTYNVKCNWTIKVRPGRTIKLRFDHFNITNTNNVCNTYVVLHNGDSREAPFLASGKYCGYEYEKKTDVSTSSNALFVSYTSESSSDEFIYQTFKIYYEEENYVCGLTSKLTPDHSWETISSPNYPSFPISYSECDWVFSGPPGDILRVDFIDTFDLDNTDNCGKEVIEVSDGISRLSPPIGRYCGRRPGTIKTSSNAVYISYSTQLSEPRNGFKANISIDVCGGTIIADSGEVASPGYPQMQILPYGTVCMWHIIGPRGRVILIEPQDIQLPHSQPQCATKIDIEETNPVNKTITILKTICNDYSNKNRTKIKTLMNKATIKLTFGKPVKSEQISENRGFRFRFYSFLPNCGGTTTTSEGYLTSPGYPLETAILFCAWFLQVPDKSRRIRLDIIDTDQQKQTVIVTDGRYNISPTSKNNIYESVNNELDIWIMRNALATSLRFKAKFSSDERALCGGDLSSTTRELVSPDLQTTYICKWHYSYQDDDNDQNSITHNSIFITVNFNSSVYTKKCHYDNMTVIIESKINNKALTFRRKICINPEVSYRIPSSVFDITAMKGENNKLSYFHLNWKAQPCGGTVHVGTNPINIIKTPDSYNDYLDCAWILMVPDDYLVEIKMEGSFILQCDDEYVTLSHSLHQNIPVIGRYCQEQPMDGPLLAHYNYIYIQYHSNVKSNTSIKLIARIITNQCGGLLTSYQTTFTSPNYPKAYTANVECMWEMRSGVGYRVSVQFIGRFVVEDTPNCTKDVIIIYDWKDDAYQEMARVCGRQAPPAYNSTYDRLKIVFRTDAKTNLDGFKAKWTSICGGKYIATDKEQILYSPGYPYEYARNMNCSYELSTTKKQKILLKFLTFELEGYSPECTFDNLTVIFHSNYSYMYRVFCGSKIPAAMHSYELIGLKFKTDSSLERTGFKISFRIYTCDSRVNDTSVIKSSFDDSFYESVNCTWFIEAPPNKVIVVKFFYIDLEVNSKCRFSQVALYDGLNVDANRRLALLCGYVNSTTLLTSTGNNMVLSLVTEHSGSYKGFKAAIYFSYSEAVGCGGRIDLDLNSSHILKSPLISNVVYENFLDCLWSITSPPSTAIKITFVKFHIAPCQYRNQTATGHSECDCDLVEIKDGLNPNSIVMGTFCGDELPPQLTTSANMMSVRLSTDGELVSSGFEVTLTVQQTQCGETVIPVTLTPRLFRSPGYNTGSIPSGLHCIYHLDFKLLQRVRITIVNLQLRPPVNDSAGIQRCLKDKLIISSAPPRTNFTLGNHLIINHLSDEFSNTFDFAEGQKYLNKQFELCGYKEAVDIYVFRGTTITLITSPFADNEVHRGVEIEIALVGFCGRNYTEAQGRINTFSTQFDVANTTNDNCYTLITAPENYTISAYFIDVTPIYGDSNYEFYLKIFDGDKISARVLTTVLYDDDYDNYPVFSSGRYMLLHNHQHNGDRITYDINYVTSNKGRGCGGKLSNMVGAVTSPLFPNTYRYNSICEWTLETPVGTRLVIHFKEFDLGVNCQQNYLRFVDSKGAQVRTFCSEFPADYMSDDNYLKLVFYTSMNNFGRGWTALFMGTKN